MADNPTKARMRNAEVIRQWQILREIEARRGGVTIEFGPPLRVTRGAYTEGTAALRAAVAAMFDRLRRRG